MWAMPTTSQRIYVSFKGDRGFMDLTFSEASAHLFAPEVVPLLEDGMELLQTGESASIRICIDGLKVAPINGELERKLRAALSACVRLTQFFRTHKETLISLAVQSRTALSVEMQGSRGTQSPLRH